MIRILFLNRSYYPDVEATGQLLTELCEDLSSEADVTVITGQPNWNAANGVAYRTSGIEHHNGVQIHRVKHTQFPKRHFWGRLANQITFFFAATWAAVTTPRPDVVVAETDPPFIGLLGALVRRRHHCRLVMYLQDIYPDIAVALGKLPPGFPTNLLARILHGVYRSADHVVVLSEDMRQTLLKLGAAPEKISVVHNWVDCQRIEPVPQIQNRFRDRYQFHGKFVVMYSGNMGLSQNLDDVLDAAQLLRDRSDVEFALVGDGARRPDLQRRAEAMQLKNVRFLPYQAYSDLSDSLSAADLHLVPLDRRVVPYLMPSKLYGILAAGVPILAIAPEHCELARMVAREEVGFVVPPAMPRILADRIGWCAQNRDQLVALSRAARQLAVDYFDRRPTTQRLGRIFASGVNKAPCTVSLCAKNPSPQDVEASSLLQ